MFSKLTTVMGIATALGAGAVTLVTLASFNPADVDAPRMIVCSDVQTQDDPTPFARAGQLPGADQQNSLCTRIKGRTEAVASL
ncbi:hypothetical protein [Hwanghaeella sp.]|uniref:hypothetical protein n=1 Tax=Hwanghaeella sp. TaxID=2605943 RepID=UPI003CCBC71D